jgi:malate dehydrogenase (oxaloacetate-decarboxylating)(NADP+)
MTSNLVKLFGLKPNIAMLSFSNFGGSKAKETAKVSEAVKYIHTNYPEVVVDGPVQADFVFNSELLKEKFPFSKLNGKKTNVLIFPNLDSANITYKMMKELYKAESIGPIMLGFKKPVHILQLGASVDEMVNMAAIAIIDAQEKERMSNKKK